MQDLSKIENIYLAPGAMDLRKSIDGCSNIVSIKCFLILSTLLYLSSATEQRQQSRF